MNCGETFFVGVKAAASYQSKKIEFAALKWHGLEKTAALDVSARITCSSKLQRQPIA